MRKTFNMIRSCPRIQFPERHTDYTVSFPPLYSHLFSSPHSPSCHLSLQDSTWRLLHGTTGGRTMEFRVSFSSPFVPHITYPTHVPFSCAKNDSLDCDFVSIFVSRGDKIHFGTISSFYVSLVAGLNQSYSDGSIP